MGRQSLQTKAKRRKTAAQLGNDRDEALGKMNSKLKRKFKMLDKSFSSLQEDNLRYYWKIGKHYEDVRREPDQYAGADGESGTKLLQQALATQARTLRKAAKFAEFYDKEKLDELVALRNETTGYQLHWGHVSFLLTLGTATDSSRRESYAREAVTKMLDPPALHDLIKKRLKRSGHGGRSHTMPKTVHAQIRQILTICRAWVGKNQTVWNGESESIFGNIMNLSPEEMEPDMVEHLQEIETLMSHISEQASTNTETARRAKDFLAATLTARQAEESRVAESDDHARAIDLDNAPGGRSSAA